MGKITLTKAAKDFMLENYGKVLAADIAKYLEVSTFTIQKWADKLGLLSDCSPKQRLDFSKKRVNIQAIVWIARIIGLEDCVSRKTRI